MPQILGNENSRREIETLLKSPNPPRNLLLEGPDYIGKKTFICSFLEDFLGPEDLHVADVGPEGAREARNFCDSHPVLGSFRAIVVDEADRLSEPAQDAWLKLCEETPDECLVIFIVSDRGLLVPPLLSRFVHIVRWNRLSNEEIPDCLEFVTEPTLVALCDGRPGLYQTIMSGSFQELRHSVLKILSGDKSIFIPEVVKKIKSGRSKERDAISIVCRSAVIESKLLNKSRSRRLLQFCADITRIPSANVEIHWYRACFCD
jgi:hypothetical protein